MSERERERERELGYVICNFSCRKKSSVTEDVAVSVNVAYKDVRKAEETKRGLYENLDDMIIESTQLQPA